MNVNNSAWLITACKEILIKAGNPYINILNSETAKRINYNNFGINIVIENNAPITSSYSYSERYIPEHIDGIIKEILSCNMETKTTKITIDKKTFLYDLSGWKIWTNDKELQSDNVKTLYFDAIENENRINHPIASISENIIWIYIDLSSQSKANQHIAKYIISEAIKLIIGYEKQAPEDYEVIKFRNIIKTFWDSRNNTLIQRIRQQETLIKDFLARYIETHKELEQNRKEIANISIQEKELDGKAVRATKYFTESKKVESWKPISDSKLEFNLQNLTMTYRKYKIDLPKLKVIIDTELGTLSVANNDPRFNNLINIHPHVFQSGEVCLGNFTTIYPKIVAQGNFDQVIDLIIQFMENYNPNSPVIKFESYITTLRFNKSFDSLNEEERNEMKNIWQTHIESLNQEDDQANEDDEDDEQANED